MNRMQTRIPNADSILTRTLPASAYTCPENFAAERERIHLSAWQIVCHVSDVPAPGDFFTLEGLGERAFVIRGNDGEIRGFHNVCPHRAHAVVTGSGGPRGHAAEPVRCPYHAWAFGYDGGLRAIAAERAFPPFDNGEFGLRPVACEIWMGFIFIRFRDDGPSVAERYGVHESELAPYRFADMEPVAEFYEETLNADWKNVWDNYLEDYHFPTGHPGLFALMSPDYDREPDDASRTIRLSHAMRDRARGDKVKGGKVRGGWSGERYASLLEDHPHLPKPQRRRWSYFFLYPLVSFDVYPDVMDFFHIVPTAPGQCRLRVGTYGLPGASRRTRATRFLANRIGWQVHAEDIALIESVQQGLQSSSYHQGILGEKEHAARAFQSWVATDMAD